MKKDKLDCLEYVDSQLIEKAETYTASKKKRSWAKWSSAIAACLVIAVGVGSFLIPRMGSNSAPGSGAGGSGHDEGSVFMSYAGPVFPLTLQAENAAISADRNITMDFSPWIPVWISNEEEVAAYTELTEEDRQAALNDYNTWYPDGGRYQSSGNILVTDSYTLTNTAPQAQTVRVLYPFVSSLNHLGENLPTLHLNGAVPETILHAGSYAGGFQGAWANGPTEENPGSLNLDYFDSWEGYRDLLSDGSYLQRALGEFVDLSDIPVTVYAFTDPWGPERDGAAGMPNPTIRVMFELDYTKTKVLSYGFNQGLNDMEKGTMGRGFSISRPNDQLYGETRYLIILGDDVANMRYEGYVTGGWDTKETAETGVTVTRSETNLEEALRAAALCRYGIDEQFIFYEMHPEYDFELYFGLLKEHLVSYGLLAVNAVERYDAGMLEELDVSSVDRVLWLEAEVTIPAGDSIILSAAFEKKPSFDFHCAATENKGISGYDLVTALGSNLRFDEQSAKLEDQGQIEIVRQNFGFDLANGITEVKLTEPHYYLEVKSAEKK